MKKVNLFKN